MRRFHDQFLRIVLRAAGLLACVVALSWIATRGTEEVGVYRDAVRVAYGVGVFWLFFCGWLVGHGRRKATSVLWSLAMIAIPTFMMSWSYSTEDRIVRAAADREVAVALFKEFRAVSVPEVMEEYLGLRAEYMAAEMRLRMHRQECDGQKSHLTKAATVLLSAWAAVGLLGLAAAIRGQPESTAMQR